MKITKNILTVILICLPMFAWADTKADVSSVNNATSIESLKAAKNQAIADLAKNDKYESLPDDTKNKIISNADDDAKASEQSDNKKEESKPLTAEQQAKIDAAQQKLDEAKEKEQSFANRMLGGLSMATMGLGGMQMAQGLSEMQADKAADKDMDAYIATMRCTYGDGKQVKWDPKTTHTLPVDSQFDIITTISTYKELAANLKQTKEALGLRPGIESQEILDKAGLYDDENTGTTGGAYASRYRAEAGNEKDQKGIKSEEKEAKTRAIAGGAVAAAGLIGSIVGNALINEKDKDKKSDENSTDSSSSDSQNSNNSGGTSSSSGTTSSANSDTKKTTTENSKETGTKTATKTKTIKKKTIGTGNSRGTGGSGKGTGGNNEGTGGSSQGTSASPQGDDYFTPSAAEPQSIGG